MHWCRSDIYLVTFSNHTWLSQLFKYQFLLFLHRWTLQKILYYIDLLPKFAVLSDLSLQILNIIFYELFECRLTILTLVKWAFYNKKKIHAIYGNSLRNYSKFTALELPLLIFLNMISNYGKSVALFTIYESIKNLL